MKRFGIISLAVLLTALPASASRLNQEDGVMPNHSADFVRTQNRNASTSADAGFYNPAGLAFLEYRGLSVHFSSQTYYAKRMHTMDYYGIQYMDKPMIPTSNFLNPANGRPKEYAAETLAPILPGVDLIWKDDGWAVYLDIHVMQAAPGMTFNQGLAVVDWGLMASWETAYAKADGVDNNIVGFWRDVKAVRTEYYVGAAVGGVYKIVDWAAAALGIRAIYATGNQNITVKYAGVATEAGGYNVNLTKPWLIDTDVNGIGFGIIAGAHFRPIEILDIGLKYEYYPPMVLKKKTNKFFAPGLVASSGNLNIFLDGPEQLLREEAYDPADYNPGKMTPEALSRFKKEVKPELKVTYPQSISLGASVKIWKGLRFEASGEIQLRNLRDLDGREDAFNAVGYRVGGCLEWTFLPKATVSVGYAFNDFGVKPKMRNEVDPLLRSHSMGGGFAFGVTDWLDMTVGAMYMMYAPESVYGTEYTDVSGATVHAINKTFDEKRLSVAIGFTLKLFGGAGGSDEMSIKLIRGKKSD
ncbi:MAG: hypothetical protein JW807_05090 [Spirochaetes bacterium]|nr:hypothetical protein [Spirochaetota bacterium]